MTAARIDPAFCDEIRSRIQLSAVIGRSVALKKRGREFTGLCPFHGEKTASFTVNDAKGFYHCFGCGAHGDAIGFLCRQQGLKFPDAVAALAAECGLADAGPAKPTPQQELERQQARARLMAERQAAADMETASAARQRNAARVIWHQSRDLWQTPAQAYLEARGARAGVLHDWWGPSAIGGAHPTPVRFAPSLLHTEARRHLPAMVAPIVREGVGLIGLHRTFLLADGSGKAAVTPAKKVLGEITGGAIRLAPAAEHLVLAEGIETAVSCMQATGLPAWAGVSLGNMAGRGDAESAARAPFHPTRINEQTGKRLRLPTIVPDKDGPGFVLPSIVRRLTIAADNDSKDADGARCLIQRAAARFALMGLQVDIAWPPKGSDFNDVLCDPRRSAAGQPGAARNDDRRVG